MTEQSRIVRILDRGYSIIWHEGRLEDGLRGLDEDFEWEATDYLDEGVRRGPDSVIRFFREWLDVWDDLEVEWELEELDPERALAVVHMRGRSRGSGVPGEMHFGQIWETRGGRFKRMRMFTDVEQARRAAGLDP
ncbi:MAG TPA: nuclear transport factor 2 family protein [Thermoleophilaceae bacterium]